MKLALTINTQYEVGQHIWIADTPYRDDPYTGIEEYVIESIYLGSRYDEYAPVDTVDEASNYEYVSAYVMYEMRSLETGAKETYNLLYEDDNCGRTIHTSLESALKAIKSNN